MNDPDESLHDELLSDLLKPMRETAIPVNVQLTNRQAVNRALARDLHRPWWKRSVAVPVPIAIAATVAFAITTIASLRPLSVGLNLGHDTRQISSNPISENLSQTDTAEHASESPAWHVTQSYIRSVPTLTGSAVFVESYAKENRNDS